ncbi:MAG: corrinoid protein [Candidatus Aminicenantes bacterium]|nr:corrinoid protein [Candidatus Aminicenantes bacterium]MDH5384533.1 corrinoid protein [Candidatus Aminicenantes bacterium]MDH5745313.1 corrinoid protein [Candidatus Aminicenantes bacterium]
MSIFEKIAEEVIKGQADTVKDLVQTALSEEISAEDILNNGLVAGMNVVSVKFKNNEFFIPEVLVSARAMNSGLDILKPLLAEANVKARGKVVIGTVKGDLHDIGKNIVGMMLQGAGFEIIDLGADVPKEKFLEFAQKEEADVVGMSALLTTTMIYMKEVIQALKDAGLREKVKVIIGGAPVTQSYADQIEADGYAPDAASAIDLTKSLFNP